MLRHRFKWSGIQTMAHLNGIKRSHNATESPDAALLQEPEIRRDPGVLQILKNRNRADLRLYDKATAIWEAQVRELL